MSTKYIMLNESRSLRSQSRISTTKSIYLTADARTAVLTSFLRKKDVKKCLLQAWRIQTLKSRVSLWAIWDRGGDQDRDRDRDWDRHYLFKIAKKISMFCCFVTAILKSKDRSASFPGRSISLDGNARILLGDRQKYRYRRPYTGHIKIST